jgi:hypothetical protein
MDVTEVNGVRVLGFSGAQVLGVLTDIRRTPAPLHVRWVDLEWPDERQREIELEGRSVSSTT